MELYFLHHSATGTKHSASGAEWTQSSGNEFRVYKERTVGFIRQILHSERGLARPVWSGDDEKLI